MSDLPINTIIQGDCLEVMADWPDGCVDMCVTSPPYWGLRDYGVDGQIGLEASPEEYVAQMVAVFAEVRRVLADHGTLWLNLGDSYTSGGRATYRSGASNNKSHQVQDDQPRPSQPPGLKEKDLCGIPWRVALALQAPAYQGSIHNRDDRIWLAAMIDGEGCIFIHKRKAGRDNGQGYTSKKDCYGSGLEVSNTNKAIVQRCLDITGKGSICQQNSGMYGRKQTLYRWNLRSNECCGVLEEVYPHLVAKQQEARLAIHCPIDGKKAVEAHKSLKSLHQGGGATIDFPAPEPMFRPGWYLRSDIIWSKCNPMPESCTDRPTKAHEYLFLLSKRAKYYYDAEAIKENAIHAGRTVKASNPATAKNAQKGKYGATAEGFTRHDTTVGNGRNRRTVWTIPTQPCSEAHFATYPEKLVEPCILAGCPQEVCRVCGKPRERVVERNATNHISRPDRQVATGGAITGGTGKNFPDVEVTTIGFTDCGHGVLVDEHFEGDYRPGIVLDPFGGSGTTGMVAARLKRNYVLIELNAEYAADIATPRLSHMETGVPAAERRTGQTGLFDQKAEEG